ncbi:hypothetical protein [Arcticibacterium luteifluviistationis]|uniref:hypothetical protein n=1 Tax=Arcticibacterium luteifluviistationis TaxID=1784714 RepID=UPI0013A69E62|nr:hypothetical protein [Arcticibacterium luteifluviistationis]
METIIVLLVVGLVSTLAFFLVKNSLSNNINKHKAHQFGRGLSREEIKEKFRHLNSVSSQIRI